MDFSFTPELFNHLEKIKKGNLKLFKKIQKQLILFKQNPYHPSLKTHKLKGKLSEYRSIYIERNLRMLYYIKVNEAVFFDMGTHDEVYDK